MAVQHIPDGLGGWKTVGVRPQAYDEALAAFQAIFDDMNIGKVFDYGGLAETIPDKHVAAFGQALDRATHQVLFDRYCPPILNLAAEVMVTAATDIVTFAVPHGLAIGDPIFFETGAGGVAANTLYYVRTVPSGSTVTLTTSRTVAAATGVITVGSVLNITADGFALGARRCPHGISGSTTFNVPDYRGREGKGLDNMGGSDAARIGWGNILGLAAGAATHTLVSGEAAQKAVTSTSESVDHTHSGTTGTVSSDHGHAYQGWDTTPDIAGVTGGGAQGFGNVGTGGITANHTHAFTSGGRSAAHTHNITGSDAAAGHNNLQPGILVNKIIYTGVA